MAATFVLRPATLAVLSCSLTSCAWLDHRTNSSLQQELVERSKHGLALARRLDPVSQIEIRFFDGRKEIVHPSCCPSTEGIEISRSRLVTVESTPLRELWRDSANRDPANLGRNILQNGGHVVAMDLRGRIVARSSAEFLPAGVALSPDRDKYAVVSAPPGIKSDGMGVYVAQFADTKPRKVADIAFPTTSQVPYWTQTMIDWSPTGQGLLLSHQGAISVIDLKTGASHKIADGASALRSPTGERISYVTPRWEHAILELSTGEVTLIDPGKQNGSPLEWSPDGKLLLVPESSGSHVPFGCLWVYRVADGAWAPIPDNYGIAGPRPHWVELGN
jgi:WD40 repeat protein